MFSLTQTYFNNSISDYLLALLVTIGIVLLLKIVKIYLLASIRRFTKQTHIDVDDLVFRVVKNVFRTPVMLLIGVNVALLYLQIPENWNKYINGMNLVIGIYYVAKAIQEVIIYATDKYIFRLENENRAGDAAMARVLSKALKWVIWLLAVVMLLQNFGINVTALIAGVGVGGIAIAFALQNVLEDIFAAFSIHFDQPFKVGDFVQVGTDKGTVKSVGLKSSRVRTTTGDELIVPNKELTQSRVRNFGRLEKRRVVANIGVKYDTPIKKLRKILEIIAKIVENIEKAELDRVHMNNLADSSINFQFVYHVDSNNFQVHMDIKQQINFEILEAFEKEGIELAFPTQTIVLEK